ncbi:MAG: sugar ABC transporter substrate-binding protein [Oscillospiraceae bacterium]|nr:sugar ABC transporter substrate-binding protein [Oscillospiraceae bacterium]
MKKILSFILATALLAVIFAACGGSPAPTEQAAEQAPAPAPAQESPVIEDLEEVADTDVHAGKRVAFINAGPDDYYKQFGDAFAAIGRQYGWDVTEINSEYEPAKELANVEDMINAGMDAIAVITVSMEAAGEACILANNAGVPIFFVAGTPDESRGAKPNGHVTDNFLYMGYLVGRFVGENYPDETVAYTIEGFLGQGTAEAQTEGFRRGLEATSGAEVVSLGSGEWQRTLAIPIMADLITSGREWNVIYGANDEMTDGILTAIEEAGIDAKDKVVVSSNGKELAWPWLKDGRVKADSPNPPSLNADLSVQQIVAHFEGRPFPQKIRIYAPAALTADNIDTAIPWVVSDYIAGRNAGNFPYQLDYYENLMKEMEAENPWLVG